MFSVSLLLSGTREMVALQESSSSCVTTSIRFSLKVIMVLPLPLMP